MPAKTLTAPKRLSLKSMTKTQALGRAMRRFAMRRGDE